MVCTRELQSQEYLSWSKEAYGLVRLQRRHELVRNLCEQRSTDPFGSESPPWITTQLSSSGIVRNQIVHETAFPIVEVVELCVLFLMRGSVFQTRSNRRSMFQGDVVHCGMNRVKSFISLQCCCITVELGWRYFRKSNWRGLQIGNHPITKLVSEW